MTTSRRILIALALVTAVAAATAALALGGGTAGPPKRALVTSQGLRAGTVLGSFCSTGGTKDGTGVVGCGDAGYPLHPHAYLPIVPGSTVRTNVRHRAKSLSASLIRVDGEQMNDVGGDVVAKPVAGSHRRVWRLRLPDDLGDANVLSIEARFKPAGDANWWAGVKPVTQWP
jgi:hypothetical protein